MQGWMLLAGVLIGFSPTLLDWGRHLLHTPWARYAAVFPFLFVAAACREGDVRSDARATRWIVLALGLALGVEVVGAFLGTIRWARPAVALAVAFVCCHSAMASWRSAVLLLFAVPVPTAYMEIATPAWAALLALPGAHLWSALGLDLQLVDATLRSRSHTLVLAWTDGGLNLAPLLAGIGWYHGVRARSRLSRALAASAGLALLAPALQGLALAGAALATALGAAGGARTALSHLPWIATAMVGVGVSEWLVRDAEGAPR